MANPRQRRKARSSSHSAIKQSRRAGKNLRKHPAIKGSKLLQEAWDRKKTVRQNYESLGLAHTFNPVAQGGAEGPVPPARTERTPASAPKQAIAPTSSNSIPRGYGKIIRDENGAVLRIELPEETEEDSQSTAQPKKKSKGRASETWGEAMDDSDEEAEKMIPSEASNWLRIGGSTKTPEAKTDGLGIGQKKEGKQLVRALEKLSASAVKTPRHASGHEVVWLKDLVAAHGRDINAMAHDLKRNVWQRTPGELKRAINKAGGFEKLETRQ